MSARAPIAVPMVLALVVSSGPVFAAEKGQDQARTLNNEGSAAFDLGNYDEAVDRFTLAYKTYPDARILFNLAQAYRKRHEYERALDLYEKYLRDQPEAPNRTVVESLIAEQKAAIAKEKAMAPKPVVNPSTPPAPLPPVVTKIEEPRPWYANVSGWVLVGGGAVAAGVGIGFFVSAGSLDDELAIAPESQRPGLRSDISTRRTVGTVFSVVGGLAVVGGVIIFIVAPRTVTRDIVPIRDLRLSVAPGQVALSWRF